VLPTFWRVPWTEADLSPRARFPVGVVKEIMRNVLKQKLQGTSYNTEVVKEISEVIRNKLKGTSRRVVLVVPRGRLSSFYI